MTVTVNGATPTRQQKEEFRGTFETTSAASGFSSITVIGDSIPAYGDGVQAGGSTSGPTSQSIPAWAFGALGAHYNIVANRAVGGKTIDLVIAEQLASAMADQSDGIWIHAGVNNLNPAIDATTPTVSEIISRMRTLLNIASAKPYVILDALTPLDPTSISGAFPRRSDIPLVNAGYEALAAEYPNVLFNDVYTPLAQDATSGLAAAGMTISSDGIHLTSKGTKTAGFASSGTLKRIALRPRHRTLTALLPPSMSDAGGTSTPNSGTITGTIAQGCNVTIIAANSAGVVVTATHAAKHARSQRLRIQNGNANAAVVRFKLNNTTSFLVGSTAGTLIRARGRLSVVSQSGLRRHDFSVLVNAASTNQLIPGLQKSPTEDGSGDSFPLYPDAPYDMCISVIGSLTATVVDLDLIYSVEVAPGGDVTIDFTGWALETVVLV